MLQRFPLTAEVHMVFSNQQERPVRHAEELDLALVTLSACVWTASVAPGGGWSYRGFAGAVEALTGRTADFFLAESHRWASIIHPEDRSIRDRAAVRVLAENLGECDYRILRPDSTVRWVRETVRVLPGETETAYAGTITDITARKMAEIEAGLLRRLTLALAETPDNTAALQACLEQVCAATGWIVGEAWVPSPDGAHLICSPAWHCSGKGWESYRRESETVSFAPGRGLMGRAWAARQPVWIKELVRDASFARTRLAWEFGLVSAFAVPVVANGKVLAVLGFFAPEMRGEDRNLLDLISGVAGLLGAFLHRRQAEDELRRERHLLATLMDSVPDGIYFKDTQSRFLRVNRAVTRRFGLADPAEAIGKADRDFFQSESAESFRADEQEVISTGKPVISKEECEAWPDGSKTWAMTTTVPLFDHAGRVVGILGISRDITARRRAEEDLRASNEQLARLVEENALLLTQVRQSEEKYRSLFEHAVEGIFQTSPQGRYLTANPALARMFGYESPAELMARVPDVRQGLYVQPTRRDEFIRRMAEDGEVRDFDYQTYRKDGSIIWIAENARAVRDGEGRLLYYEGTAEDISERKHAEEALRASEARYQALVENLTQSVFLKDADGRFIAVNGPFCACVGRSDAEILSRTDFDLYPEHLAQKYRADDLLVLRTGQRLEQEEETVVAGQTRTVRVVKTPTRDADGRIAGIVGSFWDITEHRRLETQLRQSQKMEAIGQLAGGIAHDFNNLLTAILGNLGMMRASLPGSDPNAALLEASETAGLRAAELTRQLLGFSRQTLLQLRPVALSDCLREAIDILRRTFDPRIAIEVRCPPDLWLAHVDPSQIIQVLLNLCLNARDAMPRGGKLLLETENVTIDEDAVRLHLDSRPGRFVRLRVEDSGQGIAPDVLPRIFDPFFTTKAPGRGTGLGLAMVFGIVKQHLGWVSCYSEVNRGTRFDIYLPCHEDSAMTAPAPERMLRPPRGSETILLVDDEPLIRDVATKMLTNLGYQVLTAEDGRQAVDVCQTNPGLIDLVILDLTMPYLSGQETFDVLRRIKPGIRVLFSSGYSNEQLGAPGSPDVGFVPKPYRAHELGAAIRALLDKGVSK
jgi:PAS domain S-box-containing protein